MTSVNMSGNNRNGNILAENKKISDDFIGLVSSMFETIDEVSEKIGDGKYLELANQFKTLMEFKDKMTTNVVYIEHERRTRMRVMENKRRLTLAEKLADKKKYMKCWKCDTVITKKELSEHQQRRKCRHIHSSRMITLATKMRVSKEGLIILEDTLNERTGYYWINNFDGEKEKGEKIFTVRDYYENQINHEKQSATKIQALYRGYCVRKNVKIFDGTGELPNYIHTDTWCIFKEAWKRAGKIPIYRLSEYWRRFLTPTEEEQRHYEMYSIIKWNIEWKRRRVLKKKRNANKWDMYRKMKKTKTKKDFKDWRVIICESNNFKVKGVSKMERRDIEMEIARLLWCK